SSELQYGSELLKNAQAWDNQERDPEFLLQGERRVLQAQLWLESADASDLQRDFILSSVSEVQRIKELNEKEQAEKFQLAQEAAASAKRAEEAVRERAIAERARATRFEYAARLAVALVVVAILGIIGSLFAANEATVRGNKAQNDLATATVVLHDAISA